MLQLGKEDDDQPLILNIIRWWSPTIVIFDHSDDDPQQLYYCFFGFKTRSNKSALESNTCLFDGLVFATVLMFAFRSTLFFLGIELLTIKHWGDINQW